MDGWKDWAGGNCPIPRDTAFEVKLRSGQTCRAKANQDWRWTHIDHAGDIVAYRLIAQM